MTDPAPVRPAATILLVRDRPEFEVLMVKRHHQIDFASGALVFPGGKTDPQDHDPAWAEHAVGWDEIEPEARPLRVAALREAFEESGLLLARRHDGKAWRPDARTDAARAQVARGEVRFIDLAQALGFALDLRGLTPFARWITPVMMPKRFDTHFFIAAAPEDQLAICDGWETVDAEWIAPASALTLAASGERKIIFPTRMNLQRLAESADSQGAIAAALGRDLVTVLPWVEQSPEGPVLMLPLEAGYGRVAEPLSSVGM